MTNQGRGRSPRAAEKDAAAGKRPRPDPGEVDERQPASGRKGKGLAECESPVLTHLFFLFLSLFSHHSPVNGDFRPIRIATRIENPRTTPGLGPKTTFVTCWGKKGQGGGRGSGEKDAAARERVGPNPDQPGAGHHKLGGKRKSTAKRELFYQHS